GGPTGRCVPNSSNGCSWEVHTCPSNSSDCGPNDCGPTLGLANIKCDDGSWSGPTGRCIQNDARDGCHWEVKSCPPPKECRTEDCGAAPRAPSCTCADGSLGCSTGNCVVGAGGKCQWEFRDCPKACSTDLDCD